jgi:hypothetical protein
MRISRLTLSGLLIAAAVTTASAQVSQRSGPPFGTIRAPAPDNAVSDPYGERPRDPNNPIPCSERPFAVGCDKRGFW